MAVNEAIRHQDKLLGGRIHAPAINLDQKGCDDHEGEERSSRAQGEGALVAGRNWWGPPPLGSHLVLEKTRCSLVSYVHLTNKWIR
jgi:hypothetical protein